MPSVLFLSMWLMKKFKLVGVEAAGHGLDTDKHAATMTKGSIGIVDGMKTYAVFKEDGELAPVYSISAGLDYPGVGPEHAYFKDSGRVEYVAATDEEAVQALLLLSKTEGIIPAIESSHAIAEAVKRAPKLSKDDIIIINVSGRGDKDVAAIADYLEAKKIIDGKITVLSLTESLWLLETSRESRKVGSHLKQEKKT